MSNPNPKRLLETAKSLGVETPPPESRPGGPDPRRLLEVASTLTGVNVRQPTSPGIVGSFGSGVKEGFLMPLNVFGREGDELEMTRTSEKIAGVLGNFVGLGIGFYPFTKAAGLTLKGTGLAARLSPEVAEFVKYSMAGTVQAAGTAESLEDVPQQAALGFLAGVAIDGFFLSRAIKARTNDVGRLGRAADTVDLEGLSSIEIDKKFPGLRARQQWGRSRLINDGSPIPDVPVSGTQLAKEIEIAPTGNNSVERLTDTLRGLSDDTKSLDEVLADLAVSHVETVKIPGLRTSYTLVQYAQRKFPEAQVLSRKVKLAGEDVHEVLIHNPIHADARLTANQITQWNETGFFEGMGLIHNGNMYKATGKKIAPGHVQLQSLDGRFVFAPLKTDIVNLLTPKVFSAQGERFELMRMGVFNNNEIGFAITSRQGKRTIQGTADTGEYLQLSLKEYVETHRQAITQIEAPDLMTAVKQVALARGDKGLTEVEHGITKRVIIFDESTVNRTAKFKNKVGETVDNAEFGPNGELLSFEPSWQNGIIAPLKRQGFEEKEIRTFLEIHTTNEARRLESVMDSDFQTLAQSSRAQFFEGCQ